MARVVASSCSIPGLAPAVTIGDERYMDGGARDTFLMDHARTAAAFGTGVRQGKAEASRIRPIRSA